MKRLIFMSALLALGACSQMAPNSPGREPNQYRGDDRRDRYDRRDDRRDDRRNDRNDNRWDNHNRPGNGDGHGGRDWRRRGDNRRCVNCFDMRSYNDVVRLGNEVTLLSSAFPSEHTGYVIPTACGIRSVSIEVLDNEAQ